MIGEQYQKLYDLKAGFYCYIHNGIAKFDSEAKTLKTAIVKNNMAPTLEPGERLMLLRKYDIPIAFTINLAYMLLRSNIGSPLLRQRDEWMEIVGKTLLTWKGMMGSR